MQAHNGRGKLQESRARMKKKTVERTVRDLDVRHQQKSRVFEKAKTKNKKRKNKEKDWKLFPELVKETFMGQLIHTCTLPEDKKPNNWQVAGNYTKT